MIRQPIRDFFFFGTAVRYLQDSKEGYGICDVDGGLQVRSNLKEVLNYVDKLNLKVSSKAHAAHTLRALGIELQQANQSDHLTPSQAKRLSAAMDDLRMTLEAELEATYAYTLVPKRIDASRLIEDPASLFAPNVFQKLPEIAKYDISEAARCIAFELPTAAAFHLMRATEALLREFYVHNVRTRRRAKMWAEIITDIRKRRIGKAYTVLLNHLDNIRHSSGTPPSIPMRDITFMKLRTFGASPWMSSTEWPQAFD